MMIVLRVDPADDVMSSRRCILISKIGDGGD